MLLIKVILQYNNTSSGALIDHILQNGQRLNQHYEQKFKNFTLNLDGFCWFCLTTTKLAVREV